MSVASNKRDAEVTEGIKLIEEINLKLERALSYLHVLSLMVVKDLAKEVLNNNEKIKVYLACDGRSGIRDIARKVGISHQTVSNYVRKFEKCGLVSSKLYKNSKCPEKLFDLDELGIEAKIREIEEKEHE
jgi:predicted transcriptional regulator